MLFAEIETFYRVEDGELVHVVEAGRGVPGYRLGGAAQGRNLDVMLVDRDLGSALGPPVVGALTPS